ncbi:MAG TPA: ABC transporter permease [Gemmatimonadales bacterium]|nr:ABC transporter permease [Gemmatimonadales bacterium]
MIATARRALRLHTPLVFLLAFAVAAVVVVAAAARSMVLTPPRFEHPHELVLLSNRFGHEAGRRSPASAPELLDYRERLGSLADLAAVNSFGAALTGHEGPAEQLQVGVTSGNFFQVLGVGPLHGRLYDSADDTPLDTRDSANSSILVLSHGLWRRRFGSDPGVVGRLVRVGGTPMRIVGVLPADFRLRLPPGGMTTALDAWTPLRIDYARAPRDGRYLTLVGRMAEGRSLAQVAADAATASRRLREDISDYERAGFSLSVEPLHAASVAHLRPILLLLGATVAVVLALACVNSAGMLLARLVGRGRELAIRTALGAGPARLLRQLGAEIGLVAVLGTALGLCLAAVTVRLLRRASVHPELDALSLSLDSSTVLLALVLLGFITIALAALGAIPALRATGALAGGLPDRSGIAGMGRGWRQVRGGLVAGQVALSLMLVIAAALLLRSSLALRDAPLGFEPAGVATFRISLPFSRYPGPSRWSRRYHELTRELATLPGVQSVGVVDLLPTAGAGPAPYATVPADGAEWGATSAVYRRASEGYFATLGIGLSAGRSFSAQDRADTPPVVLVDEVLARRFPPGSVLGQRLEVQVEDFTEGYRVRRVHAEIVGVVSPVAHERPDAAHQGTIYLPLAQWPTWSVAVAMRTSVPPASVVEPARRALAQLDPELPAYDTRLMEEVVRSTFAHTDLALSLVAGFALLALIVAAAGLFGLIACVVRATARDQAVRMACGASPGRLLRAQLGSGLAIASAGVAVGLVLAWPAMEALASTLPGVSATNPIALAGAAGLVLATAAATTLFAAVGVLRIEPGRLLRSP